MSCFDSCGKNPALVPKLVNKLGRGIVHSQDRCQSQDVCEYFYRCTDSMQTVIYAYGNCDTQLFHEDVGPFKGKFDEQVTCYLDRMDPPKKCETNLQRPPPRQPASTPETLAP